jgi:Zn-dependent protease
MNLEILSMLVFFSIVGILLFRDRKNIKFTYGIIIRKWSKGKYLIDKIIKNREKFLSYFGTFGVVVSLIFSFIGMYYLITCAFFPQWLPQEIAIKGCFKLVLPSAGGAEKYYPEQVLGIPFWYWLISIFIIIFFHESMHAIFARLEKVPVKSYGLIFLLALPIGAFVDPDNNKIKKLSMLKKLRIYAAGSFGNFILALIVIGIIIGTNYTIAQILEPGGINFDTVYNTPAYNASLGGIIYQINNNSIKSIKDLENAMTKINPGENVKIYTTSGTYEIKTSSHPLNSSRPYIGIANISVAYKYKLFSKDYASKNLINLIVHWQVFLQILFILSLGVGVANMLPLKPFDGGLFFEEIFVNFFETEIGKKLINILSFIVFTLILINLSPIKLI